MANMLEAPICIEHDGDRSGSGTHLALRAYRNQGFTSVSEIVNLQKNLYHASIRIRARAFGAPGAVIGMFTYLNDSNESDIEILTRGPTDKISYTNQPSSRPDGDTIPEASTNSTLPWPIIWTEWNTHRMDWLTDQCTWYVDNELMLTKEYGVPKLPSFFVMNVVSTLPTFRAELCNSNKYGANRKLLVVE